MKIILTEFDTMLFHKFIAIEKNKSKKKFLKKLY